MAGSGRGPQVAHTPAGGRILGRRRPAATRYLAAFPQVDGGRGLVARALPASVPLPAAGAVQAGHQVLGGWLYPISIALVLALIYVVECWWFPFGRCWCCSGTGRHPRKDGRVWRDCRLCRGSAKRLRVGRRIYNAIQRRRREADHG
jgi:hypothetical protein